MSMIGGMIVNFPSVDGCSFAVTFGNREVILFILLILSNKKKI